jgi:hypothetical protein
MIDKREQILAQLKVILDGVLTANPTLVKTVVRNRQLLKNESRPAIVLLDGDETVRLSMDRKFGRAQGFAPQIMQMRPQVFIVAEEGRPNNSELGPADNALRVAIISAIHNDDTLKTLYGANGALIYNNTVTDMKSGGAVTGLMMLDFAINYLLTPT